MNLRIKTNLDSEKGYSSRVYTLFHDGLWITLISYRGKNMESWETNSPSEAGQNHLMAACELRKKLSHG